MEYFEDVQVGSRTELGSHTFTADEIKAFARKFDPQPFHLDETAAARSHFGGLIASGWHTAALWIGLTVRHHHKSDAARRASGEPVAQLGLSPGFRELKWSAPVRVGDVISYATEVLDKRISRSRRGWGLLKLRNTGTNQDGRLVISFISTVFLERRPD